MFDKKKIYIKSFIKKIATTEILLQDRKTRNFSYFLWHLPRPYQVEKSTFNIYLLCS